MAKAHSKFVCQSCGYESAQFMGKCPNCGEWNSLVETIVQSSSNVKAQRSNQIQSSKPIKLTDITVENIERMKIGIDELDQVLGGGLVSGQVILLAGEPGIGKSTLLLQIAAAITNQALVDENLFTHDHRSLGNKNLLKTNALGEDNLLAHKLVPLKRGTQTTTHSQITSSSRIVNSQVLYASGEESAEQISIRASRLGLGKNAGIQLLAETNVENIIEIINDTLPLKNESKTNVAFSHLAFGIIIVDSIQTVWTEELTGTPGSVGQVRESARKLLLVAKDRKIPLIIVGHVTKEGTLAGPKVLEHLVDTVLYLEGEQYGEMRLLRVTKNRFGPTDEVGIFRMVDDGLHEVTNPSEAFYKKRKSDLPGLATVAVLEGTRPLLVEVQALVSPSELKSPRRVGNGVNFNRLSMLIAILSKHLRLPLERFDVFVNVSGGLVLDDPGADLGIAMAIYTSFKNKALPKNAVCIGELTLLGEIRTTQQEAKRTKEAKRLGLTTIYSSATFSSIGLVARQL